MDALAEPAPRYRLPKERRLARQRDFQRVYQARCSVADDRLVVYAAGNELELSRLGVSASKKLGGAVRRNRYKRLIREAFRLGQHDLPAGFDFVLIPRPGGSATLTQYRESLAQLARKAADRWTRSQGRK